MSKRKELKKAVEAVLDYLRRSCQNLIAEKVNGETTHTWPVLLCALRDSTVLKTGLPADIVQNMIRTAMAQVAESLGAENLLEEEDLQEMFPGIGTESGTLNNLETLPQ